MPKYALRVELVGTDGNAFALIGKVRRVLAHHISPEEAAAFTQQAFAQPSYDALLKLISEWIEPC